SAGSPGAPNAEYPTPSALRSHSRQRSRPSPRRSAPSTPAKASGVPSPAPRIVATSSTTLRPGCSEGNAGAAMEGAVRLGTGRAPRDWHLDVESDERANIGLAPNEHRRADDETRTEGVGLNRTHARQDRQ